MSPPDERKLFGPVLAAATTLQTEGEAQLTENLGTIIDGIHAIAELASAENIVNEAAKIEVPTTPQTALNSFLTAEQGKQIVTNIPTAAATECDSQNFASRKEDQTPNKFETAIALPLFFIQKNEASTKPTDDPRICGNDNTGEGVCEDTVNIQTTTQLAIKGGAITAQSKGAVSRKTDGTDEYTPASLASANAIPPQVFFTSRLTKAKKAEMAAAKLNFKVEKLTETGLTGSADFQIAVMQIFLAEQDRQKKQTNKQQSTT
uniref:Variant surface glycoprotein 1125.3007 n=1 Tax=Trypanosoma brucei TaxID=5691 RepID=A0A1J0R947_9TRYP|nr:variant surface glycoprotein 1125.3007 [Trypanosoma brucei]